MASFTSPFAIRYMKGKLHPLLADCLLRLLCIRAGIQGWSQQCGSFEVEANERSISSFLAGDGIFNPANDGTAGLSNDVVTWMNILIQYLISEENFIQ